MNDDQRRQNAQEIADIINGIKKNLFIKYPTPEDLRVLLAKMADACHHMKEHASFYDSAAVLNPHWSEHGGKLLDTQARGVESLMNFINSLLESQELKDKKAAHDAQTSMISKMFGI